VEGDELLVQGDQRERVGEALRGRGFGDVRRGN
jgi:translation initiation factor 1 (eIF-1/SUI1)